MSREINLIFCENIVNQMNRPSQFLNAVKAKKGPIHEFSDAIPLHL